MKTLRILIAAAVLAVICASPALASESKWKDTAPESVKALSYSYSKIRVSWDVMDGADGYIVYRSSDVNGPYKRAYTTDNPEKRWYINTNRKAGQTWWYKVRGYQLVDGKKIFSKYSRPVSAYARPRQVKMTSIDSTGFIYRYLDLKWQKVDGASGYQVYMKAQESEKFAFMGNFRAPEASVELPDTTKEYDLKVRAYQIVDGKKVYGRFSSVISYEFDWTEEDLLEAGTAYIQQQWPEATFDSTLSSGDARTPYNGTSWLAVWPKRFCLYEPWEDVESELYAAIDADVKMRGRSLQDVCFYITQENDTNWVSIYLLS